MESKQYGGKYVAEIFRRASCDDHVLRNRESCRRSIPGNLATEWRKNFELSATKPDDHQRAGARRLYKLPRHDWKRQSVEHGNSSCCLRWEALPDNRRRCSRDFLPAHRCKDDRANAESKRENLSRYRTSFGGR